MTVFAAIETPFRDPVLVFATVMATALLAPLMMRRLRLPGLVGLMLAGAVVGPSGLHFLTRDATMVLLGTIGLMYLMFMAGIGLDLHQFQKLRRHSLVFGLLSFLAPQLLTLYVARQWLAMDWAQSLLLGSITSTHTLVAYPLAARLGLHRRAAVTMAVGGTLVTDSLGLAILAVVIAGHGGAGGGLYWSTFALKVSLCLAAILWGVPRLGWWFFRTVRQSYELEFAFLMTVLFTSAFLAQYAGLAPIIGAFLAGLAVNRLVPEQSVLMARLKFNGEALFVPLFLLSVGLLVDVRALIDTPQTWVLAAILTALVLVGKALSALVAQSALGYERREGWLIAGLSMPQAAGTLAVTLIGFEKGLFDAALVNAVIVLILVTCVMGSALVQRFGLRIVHDDQPQPAAPIDIPQRILVPLSNPQTSDYLLDLAFLMRDPAQSQPILPMMVLTGEDDHHQGLTRLQERLGYAVERGAEAGVPVMPLTRVDVNAAHGIARAVREERVSMVLIGWNGQRTASERIFGTVLDQLLAETRRMVMVNKLDHPPNTTRRVVLLVPPFAERGPGFTEACHATKVLASRLAAPLEVVCEARHLGFERQFLGALEPPVPMHLEPLAEWSALGEALSPRVDASTHIVALSARRQTAPWFAELDELPGYLSEKFPQATFSIVYLGLDSPGGCIG